MRYYFTVRLLRAFVFVVHCTWGKHCPCLDQIAKAEAGQQPCCPASALTCSPVHRPRLLPLSALKVPTRILSSPAPPPQLSPCSPASPPSSLLLPPPPARLPPVPHCCRRVVPSCPVPLGLASSVAVVCDKRDNKSEKKKREE